MEPQWAVLKGIDTVQEVVQLRWSHDYMKCRSCYEREHPYLGQYPPSSHNKGGRWGSGVRAFRH